MASSSPRAIKSRWGLIGDITASGTLEFLGQLRSAGLSAQTYNNYLTAIKQFSRWLVRDRRTLVDPLMHLSKINVRTDRRHDRRALSEDEFARLIEAARNGKRVEGISGPDRAMMYVLAAWTGFRKGEVGSLTLRSLQLDDDRVVAGAAECTQQREADVVIRSSANKAGSLSSVSANVMINSVPNVRSCRQIAIVTDIRTLPQSQS
jgi:integrase